MVENELDLWPPDLGVSDPPRSPVNILRQQAAALSGKLNKRVIARVETRRIASGDAFFGRHKTQRLIGQLQHRMLLVVPDLDNYELELLMLVHGEESYPIMARLKAEPLVRIQNEEELLGWLRQAFASDITRRALSSLLSLVQ